ncbi:MAG: 4Fe-4S dicluster domain-containing protein [Candidatus Helarchaeota archaeon]
MENFDFRRRILDKHVKIGTKLDYCYQCNKCTEKCPVATTIGEDKYNPRKLVLHSLIGNMANVLPTEVGDIKLWGCTYCDSCDEVCPNDVELTEIFYVIKNILAEKKQLPEFYITQATTIKENGKAIPLMSAIERRRDQMGLPKIPAPDVSKVQTIMKETGMDNIL